MRRKSIPSSARSRQVSINLDVQARRIHEGQSVFEVALVIRAEARDTAAQANGQATTPAPTVFVAELTYAGVFTLNGLPENAIEPVLLVECPRILFPFARNILADVTRDGGFPPVLLQPIDFVALWQSRRNQPGASSVSHNRLAVGRAERTSDPVDCGGLILLKRLVRNIRSGRLPASGANTTSGPPGSLIVSSIRRARIPAANDIACSAPNLADRELRHGRVPSGESTRSAWPPGPRNPTASPRPSLSRNFTTAG